MTNEEKAQSSMSLKAHLKQKSLELILKQQIKLTIIQYIISFFILILGYCLYKFLDNIHLKIGAITVNDVVIQQVNINLGTILILISIYMIAKITLNLNIRINRGE